MRGGGRAGGCVGMETGRVGLSSSVLPWLCATGGSVGPAGLSVWTGMVDGHGGRGVLGTGSECCPPAVLVLQVSCTSVMAEVHGAGSGTRAYL